MEQSVLDSPGKIRALLGDELFRPRLLVYWLDFLATVLTGWIAFWFTLPRYSPDPLARLAWFAIAVLAFYRCLIFIHEIVHLRKEKMRSFRLAWNALCGCLFFLPDFTYRVHLLHHSTATFSTKDDPEYLPMAHHKTGELVAPFFILLLVPVVMMARFLIAAPVSWVVGGAFREWLLSNASNLKMNPQFRWKNITEEERRRAALQEAACLVFWAVFLSAIFWSRATIILVNWYLMNYAMLVLNHVRSIVAHRYTNDTGEGVSYEEQLKDSVTLAGFSPIAVLLAPVGLRYHALHHLFPTLPYYALGKAHRRLVLKLPPDHAYIRTIVPGVWPAFREFVATRRTAGNARARHNAEIANPPTV